MDLEILEATGHPTETRVANTIRNRVNQGNLGPYLFTRKIVVARHAVPHSHPILTLNTRWVENPDRILAQLLHEEWHWWAAAHPLMTTLVIKTFQAHYPNLPIMPPAGANGLKSTYLHILVCALEYFSMAVLLCNHVAEKILRQEIHGDYYTEIYTLVERHKDSIAATLIGLGASKLLPIGLLARYEER